MHLPVHDMYFVHFQLLETTHRRLRQTETRMQAEITELRERLGQEEEVVGTLRQEVVDKEQQVEKTKRLVKEVSPGHGMVRGIWSECHTS